MVGPSAIEWTDATWNPVRGCTRVSPGCGGPGPQGGCYAERVAARFSGTGRPYEGIAEELAARTGCCGCPLASKDLALDRIVADPAWDHYAPLKPIYRALRLPRNRLWALGEVLAIQAEINASAAALGRLGLDLLNAEEETRIRALIALETWPDGWDGDEPTADTPLDAVFPDGTVQPLLIRAS